jgi:hypothetical protein
MLCYLRHPGRTLRAGEMPPAAVVRFVADQIGVLPDSIGQYLTSEQNRRRHSAALLRRLNLRPFGPKPEADLVKWLLPQAIDDDRLIHLAALTMEECRRRGIIVPPPAPLDRICREVRHKVGRRQQYNGKHCRIEAA